MIFLILSKEDDELIVHIYTEYNPLLKCMARKIVGNDFTADDMVQDTIIKLMSHLPTLQKLEQKALVSYCVRTVESVSFDYLYDVSRRKRSQRSQEECYRIPALLPDELLERDEIADHVKTMLSELSQLDRHLLIYKYFMCFSHKQIGYLLGIEPKYISTYVKRARDRAKRILKKKGDYV